ncbi:MAG: hypothetical protein KGI75_04525 [Rhizobiaceae bacterium]|nr:hypothetical protein [Rhizobiaceae bacterium]
MGSAKVNALGNEVPTAEEICRQLARILTNEEFHSPDRGRKFLQFIVDETLAGRSEFLKAFTIANQVFGREVSFDAQNDPVVRIEAGRIRRALERYYLISGQDDEVIITIPKGRYVPHFEYARSCGRRASRGPYPDVVEGFEPAAEGIRSSRRFSRRQPRFMVALGAVLVIGALCVYTFLGPASPVSRTALPEASVAKTSEPNIVIESFDDGGVVDAASDFAHGLRSEIIGQLAKFADIVVIADPSKANPQNPVGYALQGDVQLDGDRIHSVARLVRQSDGAVIWAKNYDADLRASNKLDIQADVAEQIASAVAQPYSVMFQSDAATIARQPQASDGDVYACILAYYSYRKLMNLQSHDTALDCLKRAVARFPDSATSWALLSLTYLDELRFRYKLGAVSSDHPLDLAASAAEHATALAPSNARALQALMLVSFFKNDMVKALEAGTAAYAANPNDTEVAGEYGLRLAMSGKWESGCELISNAVNKNAGPKGYYEVGMALCAMMRGDIQAAELWSRMSDLQYNPMHHLVLLSILGAAGKTTEAKQEVIWLNTNAPDLMKNVRREVSLRLQRTEDQERFFKGLRAAGIAIDLARAD